jgi:hypothetical protein
MDVVKREPDSGDEACLAPSQSDYHFGDVKSEGLKCEPEVSSLKCFILLYFIEPASNAQNTNTAL